MFFDQFHLLFIGRDNLFQRGGVGRLQLIGSHAGGKVGTGYGLRLLQRADNQLFGDLPAYSHPALRGVHCFGNIKPQAPEMVAIGQRRIPVYARIVQPVRPLMLRVDHHVGGGIGDTVKRGGDNRRTFFCGHERIIRHDPLWGWQVNAKHIDSSVKYLFSYF